MSKTIVLFIGILLIALLDRLKHRFWIFSLLAFPSTVLHELMHFIVALLTNGKPIAFNVIPRNNDGSYELGHVISSNATWYNRGLIGLAPLLLIPMAWMLVHWMPSKHNLWVGILYAYTLGSMLYGSLPSSADWKCAWGAPIGTTILISLCLLGGYVALREQLNLSSPSTVSKTKIDNKRAYR